MVKAAIVLSVSVAAVLLPFAVGAAGCAPVLDDTSELVAGPQVLAVRSSPPEAPAGAAVTYQSLYATVTGPSTAPDLDWAFCANRKPLAEQGPVGSDCLVATGATVAHVGAGLRVESTLPANACRVFGPDRPDAKNGQPPGRPADPDITGGYYQPLRLRIPSVDSYAVAETRIACGLAGVTQDQLATFTESYRPNRNPGIASVTIGGAVATPWEVEPTGIVSAKSGVDLPLELTWAACPADATDATGSSEAACGSESYLVFDPATRTFVTKQETLRVSWFITGGNITEPSGGRIGGDPTLAVATTWQTPAPGNGWLWVVLRDDRGGTDWRTFRLRFE